MNVALYSHDFVPSTGGVQTITLELARGLAEWREKSGDPDAIQVTVITATAGSEADGDFPFKVLRQPSFWDIARVFRNSDVIHLAGPALLPLFLGFVMRKPVVVEHHGFQTVCPNGQLFYQPEEAACPGHFVAGNYRQCFACNRKVGGRLASLRMLLLTPLRRWLSNGARVNITPTDWLASTLLLKRQKTVHHGLPEIPLEEASSGPAGRETTFAYQGRLVSTKGVRVLLRAFEQLWQEGRAVRVIIGGMGPEEDWLRSQASKFGRGVEFLGHVPRGEVDLAFASAASVVMPSMAGEVFGLVAAENMQRGKVVIASDIGPLCEVVGNAGLLFPAGDAAALANCMRTVMDNPSKAAELSRAGRTRAASLFGRRQMIEAHVAIYRGVLAGRGRRR